jgi:asparagine synthase (glutamine-hydrolysing)
MCGIVGLYERRGAEVDRRVLDAMTDRLQHRGPDGRGTYVHQGVGFGHRRLSIIGVSDGQQPMANTDRTLFVTFNGEIYNYVALKAELQDKGYVFRTRSDTEVLVHGYQEWGDELVRRLRGIFAFAIHDQKARTVFAARDHLGVKPFYYHLTAERFVFASEPKAILVHPYVPKRPDLDAIHLYLRYGMFPAEHAAFDGLKQLEPGSWILVRENEVRQKRYWLPPALARGEETASKAELAEEMDRRVDETVDAELMSEVPLGAFLSGGVDSSTVAAAMAKSKNLDQKPRTFCIGFDQASYDESEHSRNIARALSLDHTVETLSIRDLAMLETLVETYDEPFADASAIPTYALCKMARKHVTVALSGDGGDEVFAGYRRYQKLAKQIELPKPFRGLAHEASRFYPAEMPGSGTLRQLALESARQYETELSHPMFVLSEVIDREVMSRAPKWSIGELFDNAPGDTLVAKAQWCDLVAYLPSDILVKVDRASMAHALEVRVPLLDYQFVEWASRLSEAETFGGGEGKVALKEHLGRRVPKELFMRPKMGFGVPLEFWLGGDEGLTRLADRLRSKHPKREFYAPIHAGTFDRLVSQKSRHDHSALIWSLLFLETWWQKFFV